MENKEAKEASDNIIMICVCVVFIAIIVCIAWWAGLFSDYQGNAFNSQVQGLVTEYCTAPRSDDQQAARQQLIRLVDGKPGEFRSIPAALHSSAQATYDNQRMEACHQDDPSH